MADQRRNTKYYTVLLKLRKLTCRRMKKAASLASRYGRVPDRWSFRPVNYNPSYMHNEELTVLKPGRHRVATHVEGEERTCPLE
ncbi:hypothetical protein T07_15295 [Trichinella nelsoni]|uniref:Uncharacterized protein n=2 Tax=Trichinella TaxID=6333 RepID=A0A0V0SCZ2_9BILA|nr:hypothetical protein T07_15295 [Trichinella nelsoni]KRY42118.1 hypothetical protein T01_4666 [Trichinella spiralis]